MILFYIGIGIFIISVVLHILKKLNAKKSTIVFGIVTDELSTENFKSTNDRARKVKIKIESDDVSFLYRPKTRFNNVSFGMAVDFYKIGKKDGSYRYIAVDGYYFDLLYLYGLSISLMFSSMAF